MATTTTGSPPIADQFGNLGKAAADNPIAAMIVVGALVLVLK